MPIKTEEQYLLRQAIINYFAEESYPDISNEIIDFCIEIINFHVWDMTDTDLDIDEYISIWIKTLSEIYYASPEDEENIMWDAWYLECLLTSYVDKTEYRINSFYDLYDYINNQLKVFITIISLSIISFIAIYLFLEVQNLSSTLKEYSINTQLLQESNKDHDERLLVLEKNLKENLITDINLSDYEIFFGNFSSYRITNFSKKYLIVYVTAKSPNQNAYYLINRQTNTFWFRMRYDVTQEDITWFINSDNFNYIW